MLYAVQAQRFSFLAPLSTIPDCPEHEAPDKAVEDKRRDKQELGNREDERENCAYGGFKQEDHSPHHGAHAHRVTKALMLPQRVEPRDVGRHVPCGEVACEVKGQWS